MCIGPVKPGVTLGQRLLQAGVISPETCNAVEFSLGERCYSEPDAARAFVDARYCGEESLPRWALKEASQVLSAILAWEDGDLYFEEDQLPPTNRFAVPLSIASLMPPTPSTPSTISAPPAFISTTSLVTDSSATADGERHTDVFSPASLAALQQPQRVTDPISPVRIDRVYLQPNMVLVPADLSAYRESNPQVLLTQ